MKLFLSLFIPYFFIIYLIFGQEAENPNPPAKTFTETIITRNIEYFEFKDLSNDIYSLSLVSNKADELIEELNGKKNKKLRIEIGDIKTDILVDTAEYDQDNLSMVNFSVVAYYKIPVGKTTIKLYSKFNDQPEVLESSKDFIIPESNDLAGKQPFIISITPEGGIRGDTITLTGNNFGKKVDDIVITFFDSVKKNDGEETHVEVAESKPFFLSVPVNETQEVKFNIPLKRDLLKGHKSEST